MNDSQDIIKLLWHYGHFRNPMFSGRASWDVHEMDLPKLTLMSLEVQQAVQSYQSFMGVNLEPICQQVHERAPIADGDIGPATEALFDAPRCNVPDFSNDGSPAVGSGSWVDGCLDDYPDNHGLRMSIDTRRMPSFLQPVFDTEVWPNVVESYREIGILIQRVDRGQSAHMTASFVVPDGGWIGLAIVPGSGVQCNRSIWQRYAIGYRPSNIAREWITLFKHEIGHNLNLRHTSGGVMNPGIVRGLPTTWKGVGDPSEPILRRYFGGDPVPRIDEGPKFWTHQGFKDEKTNDQFWVPLHPPLRRDVA